jgi:hypothetical protein
MMEKRDGYINMLDDVQLIEHWERQNMPQQWDPSEKGVLRRGACLKCAMRNVDAAHQIFACKAPNESPMRFSKAIADQKIRSKVPHVIPLNLLKFHIYQNEFDEAHVAHVAAVDIPGVVVFGAVVLNGKPALFSYLIDGTHRAVARVRACRPFEAYCLNSHETAFCAIETDEEIKTGRAIFL